MKLDWTIVDGIGPFFRFSPKGTLNWSKIPFDHLEKAWEIDPEGTWRQIEEDFSKFCAISSRMGFNVVTLDDLAHLIPHDIYPDELNLKIHKYRKKFSRLFKIAESQGLQVWITSDIVFTHQSIQKLLGKSRKKMLDFFVDSCKKMIMDFPGVSGLVLRFGESDGLDVEGDFRSILYIKRPGHLRNFLDTLLPIFEENQRTLVLRTWTVGVYPIGDIIWNTRTLNKSLKGLVSENLVLSMKYGESDFFRYLPLNEAFWATSLNKIIELQCRREYEGAGRFPSFIGYEYEIYRDELLENSRLKGAMLWVQTGGWTRSRRLTFLEPQGIWNELNARVTVALFQSRESCDSILAHVGGKMFPGLEEERLINLCRVSHQSIRRLFYVKDFALKRLFFRRVRIPPLMGITWDTIWVHPFLGRIFSFFIEDRYRLVNDTWAAVSSLEDLLENHADEPWISDILDLKNLGVAIALGREHILGCGDQKSFERLLGWSSESEEGFEVKLFKDSLPNSYDLQKWFSFLVRQDARYRWIDQLVVLRLVGWLFPLVYFFKKKSIPRELRDQAMGIESLFK